jgi:hypothetical protein
MQQPERITLRTIWHGVLDIFNLERGLIQTTLTLTKRPGNAIREYLLEDRNRLMPPFRFLIFMVAIAAFITLQYFSTKPNWLYEFNADFQTDSNSGTPDDAKRNAFLKMYMDSLSYSFNNYFNLFILAAIPLAALATGWFFRRRFNYAEHLVVNSYVTGYLTVIYILLTPMLFFSNFGVLSGVYTFFTFLYSIVVYQKVYQSPGIRGVLASVGAVLTYFALYYIIFFAVAIVFAIYAFSKAG